MRGLWRCAGLLLLRTTANGMMLASIRHLFY